MKIIVQADPPLTLWDCPEFPPDNVCAKVIKEAVVNSSHIVIEQAHDTIYSGESEEIDSDEYDYYLYGPQRW